MRVRVIRSEFVVYPRRNSSAEQAGWPNVVIFIAIVVGKRNSVAAGV